LQNAAVSSQHSATSVSGFLVELFCTFLYALHLQHIDRRAVASMRELHLYDGLVTYSLLKSLAQRSGEYKQCGFLPDVI
jgi:hypothetical protein